MMESSPPKPRIASTARRWSILRIILTVFGVVIGLFVLLFAFGLWSATDQILKPSFKNVTDTPSEGPTTKKSFGNQWENLRYSRKYQFEEVRIASENGELPGWLVKAAENGRSQAEGAIMLVHAGGSDRRQMTKFIEMYLDQRLDVLTFDLSCQGEAPCNRAGITYGDRESQDVLGAFAFLTQRYSRVYAMGTSVGAVAVLLALPSMPGLRGAIAENPFASFRRLLKEAPEAQSMPGWFTDVLVGLVMWRGGFSDEKSAENAMRRGGKVPILFMHSKQDKTISPKQTEDLAVAYGGLKTVWIASRGEHAGLWEADPVAYEQTVADFLQANP